MFLLLIPSSIRFKLESREQWADFQATWPIKCPLKVDLQYPRCCALCAYPDHFSSIVPISHVSFINMRKMKTSVPFSVHEGLSFISSISQRTSEPICSKKEGGTQIGCKNRSGLKIFVQCPVSFGHLNQTRRPTFAQPLGWARTKQLSGLLLEQMAANLFGGRTKPSHKRAVRYVLYEVTRRCDVWKPAGDRVFAMIRTIVARSSAIGGVKSTLISDSRIVTLHISFRPSLQVGACDGSFKWCHTAFSVSAQHMSMSKLAERV